jgi:hypothetical protein
VVSAGVSALTLLVQLTVRTRRNGWAGKALTDAAKLVEHLGPNDEPSPDVAERLKGRLQKLHFKLWALWWSHFLGWSVLIGAVLTGIAGSSLGSRPIVAFILGALVGGLYVGAISGAFAGRVVTQGRSMAAVLEAAAKAKAMAAGEVPFTRAALSSGDLEVQIGGFVRLARAYAGQPAAPSPPAGTTATE